MPSIRLYSAAMLGGFLLSGCSSQPDNAAPNTKQGDNAQEIVAKQAPRLGIVALFKKLEIGMSRQQVEAIVGSPVYSPLEGPGEDLRVDYLRQEEYQERGLLAHESPISLGGIFVTYRRGILVEKGYNSQWVKAD